MCTSVRPMHSQVIGYVGRRIAWSAAVLVLASVVIFGGMHALPGNPLATYESTPGLTAAQIAHIQRTLGLDQSLVHQYFSWALGALHGNLGYSYFNPEFSTASLIGPRIGPSVELAFCSIVIGLLLAVPLSLLSARRPFSLFDRSVVAFSTASIAVPPFWLAVLLIALLSVHFGLFPTRGYVSLFTDPLQNLRLIFLPASRWGSSPSGILIRFLRSSLLDTATADFVRTARGKGLTRRQIMRRHVLPNASLPTLNVVGVLVGSMLGGIVIIEYIFGWPGLGSLMLSSVLDRDYEVLEALLLFAAIVFIVSSLVVDLVTLAADPRMRQRSAAVPESSEEIR